MKFAHLAPWLLISTILPCAAAHAADKNEGKTVNLLTGQSAAGELAGFKSFHEKEGTKTGDVWTLTKENVLICKGTPLGYIYTDRQYTNFVLTLQWRWPPEGKPGKGGVLLRTTGENKIWPKSLEAQINTGDAGDFWGLDGYELTGPAERSKTLATDKFGKLTNLKKTKAVEKEPPQWNTYKITADGETVTLEINGRIVNQAEGCAAVPGTICLTAEGSEIHFRNIFITPLDK